MQTKPASGGNSSHSKLPVQLRKAVIAHEEGRLHVALPLYKKFVEQNPNHPAALQLLGVLYSQQGKYESAIKLMRESLRLFPEQGEVANNLGNALLKFGRVDEAIESYAEAIRLHPEYLDAVRNLGLCYLEIGRLVEAWNCFQRCLEIRVDDPVTLLSIGNVHRQQDNFEQAIPYYEKALELNPDYAEAHHNVGLCLRMQQRPEEALGSYEAARRLGLDRAELYHNLGNALIDTQDAAGAIDAFQTAVERNPRNLESHRNLNALLWQQNLLDDYLKSYKKTLDKYPDAVELRLFYSIALNQQERFDDAERVLRHGLKFSAESSELRSLLAYTLEGQGRWPDALQEHAATVNLPGSTPNHRISYARALLAVQRPDEALQQAKSAAIQMPFNQRALAYLGLCWRMLGDERDNIINDYENMVGIYDLPVPAQFADADAFNAALTSVLEPLHIGMQHPAEQTLRGGSQTSGNLFDRRDPEIVDLVSGLKQCINDYIGKFPKDPQHPLYSRRSRDFDFSASWSVRLGRSGYHTTHTHPLGWISSAYYVQVPPEVSESDKHGGGLKFGEPDIDIGAMGAARRVIQPTVGRLALFPSYMWHGTVPFESDEPRMTVAFDVVPEE